MKRRVQSFMYPNGFMERRRRINPCAWQWRDRILILGELGAVLAAFAAIPIELFAWGFASWCLIAAAIFGTSALLWYAFDLISAGEAPLANMSDQDIALVLARNRLTGGDAED